MSDREKAWLAGDKVLANTCQKMGLSRARYGGSPPPESADEACAFVALGDFFGTCAFASMAAQRLRSELRGSRHCTLITWPGWGDLFPAFDEVWTPSPTAAARLTPTARGIDNPSPLLDPLVRRLNWTFGEVQTPGDLTSFWSPGITARHTDPLGSPRVWLPSVSSHSLLGEAFMQKLHQAETSVVIHPVRVAESYGRIHLSIAFWESLLNGLLQANIQPVLWLDHWTHDLSGFASGRFPCLMNRPMGELMAAMRGSGLCLDIFSGISAAAILARCPFVRFFERRAADDQAHAEFDALACDPTMKHTLIPSFADGLETPAVAESRILAASIVALGNLAGGDLLAANEVNRAAGRPRPRRHRSMPLTPMLIPTRWA